MAYRNSKIKTGNGANIRKKKENPVFILFFIYVLSKYTFVKPTL